MIDSSTERAVKIHVGYDDYITLWLNGEKLLETTGGSPCVYDDVMIEADLRAGQNRDANTKICFIYKYHK